MLKLSTKRMHLQPIKKEHFEAFYKNLVLDNRTMEFWHHYQQPLSDEERRDMAQRDFFDHFDNSYRRHGYKTWALFLKEEPENLIGWCGLWASKLNGYGPEIAYMLSSKVHRQGLAVEAARIVITHALKAYAVTQFHAIIDAPNRASCRVAEKLGFTYRGLLSGYSKHEMVLYRLEDCSLFTTEVLELRRV